MEKTKILLTTLNTKYVHTNIALKYLYETVYQKYSTQLKEFSVNEPLEKILATISAYEAQIVAFSVYIWNIEETLKLCEDLKAIYPDKILVLGGPEVTYQAEELLALYPFLDYIICGEGEESFPELMTYLISGEGNLEHVTYRENGIIQNGTIGIVRDVEKIPQIAKKVAENYDGKIVYIETVRGCPYQCSYCLSSTIKGIRPFPMERVKEEILVLIKAKVRLIKFVDRTFNYDKKRAIEIWKFILDNNISSQFHFELSAHLIDEEMITFLKTVPKGIFKFEIGVQSTNPDTIQAIQRSTDFNVVSQVTREIQQMRTISLHLDLIAGLPYESFSRFEISFNDVFRLYPTELQLGFLKLLKGCKITKEAAEYSYKYTKYPPYEVLENQFISYSEIRALKQIEEMVEIFYNTGRFEKSLIFIMRYYESPFQFFYEISQFYLKTGYMERKISAEEHFDLLAQFYQEKKWKNAEIFVQYLKYDYVSKFGNKRKWMPIYESSLLKEQIEACIVENLSGYTRDYIFKHFKFEMFEIDMQTGERRQNMLIFKK